MNNKFFALAAFLVILSVPSVSLAAGCESIWSLSCGAKVVGKVVKKVVIIPTTVIAGLAGTAEALADGDSIPASIGSGLGGAAGHVADSVVETATDIKDIVVSGVDMATKP